MPIVFTEKIYSDDEIYGMLRPYVAKWFKKRFGSFTPPQKMAIPLIKKGYNVLISSPTGTGKTLAVFLGLLDNLYSYAEEHGELPEGIQIVYVSPLRALNNDMRKNLQEPIIGINGVAKKWALSFQQLKSL